MALRIIPLEDLFVAAFVECCTSVFDSARISDDSSKWVSQSCPEPEKKERKEALVCDLKSFDSHGML